MGANAGQNKNSRIPKPCGKALHKGMKITTTKYHLLFSIHDYGRNPHLESFHVSTVEMAVVALPKDFTESYSGMMILLDKQSAQWKKSDGWTRPGG